MDGRLKIDGIFLCLKCEDSNSYHLYRSVHVDVRQEWLPNSTQKFGVETQNLLFHSRRALRKSTQEERKHLLYWYIDQDQRITGIKIIIV